jgi:hypothetical protein
VSTVRAVHLYEELRRSCFAVYVDSAAAQLIALRSDDRSLSACSVGKWSGPDGVRNLKPMPVWPGKERRNISDDDCFLV